MEIILGALTSVLVQWIKTSGGFKGWQTFGFVVLVSFACAGIYTALAYVGLWESFVKIMIVAGAVYAYIISNFEKLAEEH